MNQRNHGDVLWSIMWSCSLSLDWTVDKGLQQVPKLPLLSQTSCLGSRVLREGQGRKSLSSCIQQGNAALLSLSSFLSSFCWWSCATITIFRSLCGAVSLHRRESLSKQEKKMKRGLVGFWIQPWVCGTPEAEGGWRSCLGELLGVLCNWHSPEGGAIKGILLLGTSSFGCVSSPHPAKPAVLVV